MDGEFVALAEKSFNGFLREMAVAGTDIDNERVQSARGAGQGFAEASINRLAN
jgi:hypothetical protein